MTTSKAWDVVVVAFPYVDMPMAKPRPALILSSERFNEESGHSIAAMITSSKRTHWVGDTTISDLKAAGLPTASLIRLKLFTLDHRLQPRKIGELAESDIARFKLSFAESRG